MTRLSFFPWFSTVAGTGAALAFAHWQNSGVRLVEYTVSIPRLPAGFDGFRILLVSDLHNKRYRDKLQLLCRKAAPDMIAITGDAIDSRRTRPQVALDEIRRFVKRAPVYYVTGNHEERLDMRDDFVAQLCGLGVRVLDNARTAISAKGDQMAIWGVCDPVSEWHEDDVDWSDAAYMDEKLAALRRQERLDTVLLLSHRPELMECYKKAGVTLALSGHAHGGQWRIPRLGGVFVPNQGLFPRYTLGVHQEGGCTMVISPGLGNSLFPLRLNNRPMLQKIILHK